MKIWENVQTSDCVKINIFEYFNYLFKLRNWNRTDIQTGIQMLEKKFSYVVWQQN